MAKIAKEAGISKALLYHYFPSKEAYFVATLEEKANELQQRTVPNPDLPPFEQLAASLDEYLKWIEENKSSYDKMIRNAGAAPEVRALLDRVRTTTAHRILEGLSPGGPPKPLLGPRSAAGSASWTARAWTGSITATWTGRPCTASCCPRSSPRSSPWARTRRLSG